jgi:hypothetical protein
MMVQYNIAIFNWHKTTIFDEIIFLFHSPDLSLYTEQPLTLSLEAHSILFYPILSYPITLCPIVTYPGLSHLIMSFPVLS